MTSGASCGEPFASLPQLDVGELNLGPFDISQSSRIISAGKQRTLTTAYLEFERPEDATSAVRSLHGQSAYYWSNEGGLMVIAIPCVFSQRQSRTGRRSARVSRWPIPTWDSKCLDIFCTTGLYTFLSPHFLPRRCFQISLRFILSRCHAPFSCVRSSAMHEREERSAPD